MSLRSLFAFLLAACLVLPACDTGEEDALTAAFFVGVWDLTATRDGSGDRTAEAFDVLDAFEVTFNDGGGFSLLVDLDQSINDEGTADTTIPGVYQVTSDERLVLHVGAIAPSFEVSREGNDRVELSTASAVVNQVLAAASVDLELTGTVRLTLERR